MAISGSSLKNPNTTLRFFVIAFMGLMAFGSVLYWRQKTLLSQEYVEFPQYQKQQRHGTLLRSHNYQIETEEVSPSVK